jgi:hypothetical protein
MMDVKFKLGSSRCRHWSSRWGLAVNRKRPVRCFYLLWRKIFASDDSGPVWSSGLFLSLFLRRGRPGKAGRTEGVHFFRPVPAPRWASLDEAWAGRRDSPAPSRDLSSPSIEKTLFCPSINPNQHLHRFTFLASSHSRRLCPLQTLALVARIRQKLETSRRGFSYRQERHGTKRGVVPRYLSQLTPSFQPHDGLPTPNRADWQALDCLA